MQGVPGRCIRGGGGGRPAFGLCGVVRTQGRPRPVMRDDELCGAERGRTGGGADGRLQACAPWLSCNGHMESARPRGVHRQVACPCGAAATPAAPCPFPMYTTRAHTHGSKCSTFAPGPPTPRPPASHTHPCRPCPATGMVCACPRTLDNTAPHHTPPAAQHAVLCTAKHTVCAAFQGLPPCHVRFCAAGLSALPAGERHGARGAGRGGRREVGGCGAAACIQRTTPMCVCADTAQCAHRSRGAIAPSAPRPSPIPPTHTPTAPPHRAIPGWRASW